jgi:hypothetical protein
MFLLTNGVDRGTCIHTKPPTAPTLGFLSRRGMANTHHGLVLFNRLASHKPGKVVDFYSEERGDDVRHRNALQLYQETHLHPCDNSRKHDHYHGAAAIVDLVSYYHPKISAGIDSLTKENLNENKSRNEVTHDGEIAAPAMDGRWKQAIIYDEALLQRQSDILTKWFNSVLFGSLDSSNHLRGFDLDAFHRYVRMRIHHSVLELL